MNINKVHYPAYRTAWAAIKGCALEDTPVLVQGCGLKDCVEPDHRVEGPQNAAAAGWLWDFERKLWFCKRGHNIAIVGRNKHGNCRDCKRLYNREYDRIRNYV